METKEYHFIDKSKWHKGEWENEPDKIQYTDPATGFPCLIVRTTLGHLCGYVGVNNQHKYFEKGYDEIPVDIELTYSDLCQPSTDENQHTICHIPGKGETDNIWWLGFDCAHLGEISPGMSFYGNENLGSMCKGEIYKNMNYVKKEISSLARQLTIN